MRDRLDDVSDAGLRHAGRLDDHFDLRTRDQRIGIVGDARRAALERVIERCRRILRERPSGGLELIPRARNVEVGDADDMHALRQPRLREKHGAELAGTDQADGHRPARGLPFEQQGMQVHALSSAILICGG